MNNHLTDEQFADLLLGLDNGTATSHMAACDHCRLELNRVEQTMGLFREATMDWSRQRVAAMPLPQPDFLARFGLSFRPAVGFTVAATLAIAAAVPFLMQTTNAPQTQAVQHQSPVPTTEQIAADNALLTAISQEIAQPTAQHEAIFNEESGTTGTMNK